MGLGWWTDPSLTASRNGQTVTFYLSGTAYYGEPGSRTWTFQLYKNGNATGTYITGWSTEGLELYKRAVFNNKSFTYTLSGSDLGTSVSFTVKATCNGTGYDDPQPSTSVSVPSPSITWSSGASLSATPNSAMKVVLTRNGSVTVGNGFSGTVYYRIWCESTRKNNDGDTGSSWTIDPNSLDTELTYKIQGYSSVWGREFTSSQLTVKATVVSGNYIDYYNGSAWVQCKAYYYNGSNWVECKPYYYDGSRWIEISS